MRDDIRDFITDALREGELTTRQIQERLAASGLPHSNHRYSVLRLDYLEKLAKEGILIHVGETKKDEGGGIWRPTP